MKEDNNYDKQSPYRKQLRDRRKINSTVVKATNIQQPESKKCIKCSDYLAQPKQISGEWFFVCIYPLCAYKEKFIPTTTPQQARRSTITSKYSATDNQGPLGFGSYDRKGKRWTRGKGNVLDDDFYSIVGSGAVKVDERTRTLQDGQWSES